KELNRGSSSVRSSNALDITATKKQRKSKKVSGERSQIYQNSVFDEAYMGPPIFHGGSRNIAGYVSYNPYGIVHAYEAP
ncbi:hypothetical protein ACJMK2_029541, partial [Sinanodonta woodiana]